MDNPLSQIAFRAITKDKPEQLEFCLSKLKVNVNAIKTYQDRCDRLFTHLGCWNFGDETDRLTLVQYAIHKENLECLEILLAKGADVYPRKEYYETKNSPGIDRDCSPPLHMAMNLFWQSQYDGARPHSEKAILSNEMVKLLLRFVCHC